MFEIGDVVYLKSNPEVLMTVSLIIKQDPSKKPITKKTEKILEEMGLANGGVECGWFNGQEYTCEIFKPQMLVKKN